MNDVRVIAASQSYEYDVDDLRLTVLCTQPFITALLERFRFQQVSVQTPPSLFGPVPLTAPPGLVCNLGALVTADGAVIPVRYLNIEPRRVVLAVAGSTAMAAQAFNAFRDLVNALPTADERVVAPDPRSVQNHSEISARWNVDLTALVVPAAQALLARLAGSAPEDTPAPLLAWKPVRPGTEYEGDRINAFTFKVSMRQGSRPEARHFLTTAPLPSDEHAAALEELEGILTGRSD